MTLGKLMKTRTMRLKVFIFTKTSVLFNDVVQTYPYNLCIITFMDITKQGM